jgi:curved DNA-binding protein
MEYKDYYRIMGVKRDATQDEIRRAYRRLARKYHPDVSKEPDAEARFKEVGEAYEVLKDPEKRAAYDQLGADWKSGQEFRPPPGWSEGFEFRGGGIGPDGGAEFSDFFEALFGRGEARAGRGRRGGVHAHGEDHHARVTIDLEDTYRGGTRTITLKAPEVDAQGRVITRERVLNVSIPKGIREGQHIRLAGQGGPGLGQGKAGDLYLEVAVRPHRLYRVDGRDVYLELPVAPWEAALGATVQVPTPAGAVDLKIPPRSGAGRRPEGPGHPGESARRLLRDTENRPAAGRYRRDPDALPRHGRADAVRSARGNGGLMSDDPLSQLTGCILEEEVALTLADLCSACSVRAETIIELVEEGVVEPDGSSPADWYFSGVAVRRARIVLRLQRDLGVNLAGAALALQLLEELEILRARLRALERD